MADLNHKLDKILELTGEIKKLKAQLMMLEGQAGEIMQDIMTANLGFAKDQEFTLAEVMKKALSKS